MRKSFYALLVLFSCASLYAQVIQLPVKSATALVPATKPTLKWSQAASAPLGYEVYATSLLTDTSSATIPLIATLNKNKRYVTVGSAVTDTSVILDTVLVRGTVYYWKVRAKLPGSTWGAWSKFGIFKIGAPAASIVNAGNAVIKLNHDTLSAVSGIQFLKGSSKQLLDTVYNEANKFGLGATGLLSTLGTRDTLVTWDEQAAYSVYTYVNTGKYGKTGSKILTISHADSGVTIDDSLTLESGKTV